MKNRCINLILIILLIGLNIISIIDIDNIKFADAKEDKFSSMIGVKQVIANNVDTTYTGRNWLDSKGKIQYEYKAVINQAPIYNDNGTLVDCSWHSSKEGIYSIINNIFEVTVIGSSISTSYHGQTMSWNPVVLIDSKEYVAKGSPRLIAVDPINSNYQNNTLEWDYGVCVRRVRVIEGLIQETWIFDKDPKGTVWIKDNAQKSAGFTWAIAPYAYDANGNAIPINQYKQVSAKDMASATYPVTIDPTEVYVTSASDGYVGYGGPPYESFAIAVAKTTATFAASASAYIRCGTAAQYAPVQYSVYRGAVYFDTSAIPDSATITSSNLSMYGQLDYSLVDFNISVQNGMSTYPHDPLVVGDYNQTNYTGIGNAGFNTSGFVTTGYNNISLNTSGISWINVAGVTKLLIRGSNDYTVRTPTNVEYVVFYDYEKGAGFRPTLYVTYATASQPVVTTMPATNISSTTVQLNGCVNDSGGENCQYIFYYGLTSAYGTDTGWTGSVATNDPFSANISGLTSGAHYHVNASIKNSGYTVSGNDTTFITLPVKPVSFSVAVINSSAQNVSWIKGSGAVNTIVRVSNVSYPVNMSSGTLVYNGSDSYTLNLGLTAGQTYYYSGWSFASDGGLTAFSSDYATYGLNANDYSIITDDATLVEEASAQLNGQIGICGDPGLNWYNPNWSNRIEFVINSSYIDADLTNFPVLVTGSQLNTTDPDFWSTVNVNGSDILFTASDGKTKLNRELVSINTTAKTMECYVNVTSIDDTTDTKFYMYYNSANISVYNESNSTATWDANYIAVWHMGDLNTSAISDSTANAQTGLKKGANEPLEVTGNFVGDEAQKFDAVDDYINVSHSANQLLTTGGTIESIIYANSYNESGGSIVDKSNSSTATGGYKFQIRYHGNNQYAGVINGGTIINGGLNSVVYSTWRYAGETWNNSGYIQLYSQGSTTGTLTLSADPAGITTTNVLCIGQRSTATDRTFDGNISEVRISNTNRSDSWVKATYYSLILPTSFAPVTTVFTTPTRFLYDINSGTPYTYNSSWKGAYSNGQLFNDSVSSLSYGQLYYFVSSMSLMGIDRIGSEKTFLTKPDRPYSLAISTISDSRLSLSWTLGSGADYTMVRYSTTGYPTINGGSLAYYGTGTTFDHTGLTAGTLYYYRGWEQALDGGLEQYSDTWDDESGTTGSTDGTIGDSMFPNISIDSEDWYGDLTDIPNIPMRDMFIYAAAKIGCSPRVLMSAAAIALTMAVSVSIFLFSGNIFLAMIAALIMLIGGSWTGALPYWMMVVFIVGSISIYYVLRRV